MRLIFLVLLLLILGACLAFINFVGSPPPQYQSTDLTPVATVSASPSSTVLHKTATPTARATYAPTPTSVQLSPTPEATTAPTNKGKQKENGAPTFVGG